MSFTRRDFLAVAAVPGLAALAGFGRGQTAARNRMGLVSYSCGLRRSLEPKSRLDDPATFLEHCRSLGAGGAQLTLGIRDETEATRLRARAEKYGMYLEGIVRLPREKSQLERFSAELRMAQACGALVVRTTLMAGRRYEVFTRMEDFRRSLAEARASLVRARPVVERHKIKLAVENHKDLRSSELVELLRSINSPQIGACVDTGNSIALLETPLETVEALAPLAFTVHLKDMGVEEYHDGFRLAEMPLGTGFLPLARIADLLAKSGPGIRFNLEMITRDPLRIPCLTRRYWATLDDVPARVLADTLLMVRDHAARQPLPQISSLTREEKLRREDDNNQRSVQYARERLGR
jgi:3-oxoisoapionate decarboxylase